MTREELVDELTAERFRIETIAAPTLAQRRLLDAIAVGRLITAGDGRPRLRHPLGNRTVPLDLVTQLLKHQWIARLYDGTYELTDSGRAARRA